MPVVPASPGCRVSAARIVDADLLLYGETTPRSETGDAQTPGEILLVNEGAGRRIPAPCALHGETFEMKVPLAELALGPGTWRAVALASREESEDGSVPVLSTLDDASTASGFVLRDGTLFRIRARTAKSGQLLIAVNEVVPHAEVDTVRVEDAVLIVDADLSRLPSQPQGPVSAVAVHRSGETEVARPAVQAGQRVNVRLPLRLLVSDADETELWDLYIRLADGRSLRVAGYLDGVADKKNSVVFPPAVVTSRSRARSLRPYFTAGNGLSIRSKPAVPPDRRLRPEAPGDRTPTELQRRLMRAARAVAVPCARVLVRRAGRGPEPVDDRGRPRVSIFVMHGYGMGGTVRTVFNLAAQLAKDYSVEIVSQIRDRERPFFDVPPGVVLTPLDDRTEVSSGLGWRLRAWLSRRPSILVHQADASFARVSLWTDVQLVRRLRRQQGGILIATRPSLNLLAAQLASPGVLTIGQEHMNFKQHRPELARDLHRTYGRLDALAVLTSGDLEDYSRLLAGHRTRVVQIPNSLTQLTGGMADPASRTIVAAGRLTRQKGFDLLIPAFEEVARRHPDWTLRIYGSGPQGDILRALIAQRRLQGRVVLMGRAERMGEELAKGSVFVLSSRFEGFGMVLIEAMSKGLAVASFDCPRGPADIITDGEDGILVPAGDVQALGQALLRLVEDAGERERLGSAAVHAARRYDPDAVGELWRQLFARLLTECRPIWWRPGSGTDPASLVAGASASADARHS